MNVRSLILTLVAVVVLFGFPLAVDNSYYIHLVQTIAIYAILLFGLDIVVGYTGQVSLGHAGLFGIGAYTAGVLFTKFTAPLLLTLVGGVAAAATEVDTASPGDGSSAAAAASVRPWPCRPSVLRTKPTMPSCR